MLDCEAVSPEIPFNPKIMVQGNPCKKGHNGIRYKHKDGKPSHCVYCRRAKAVEIHARRMAKNTTEKNYPRQKLSVETSKIFKGTVCKNNHEGNRYRINGSCIDCAKENAVSNREHKKELSKAWNITEKAKSYRQNKRAAIRSAEGIFYHDEIKKLMVLSESRCFYCGETVTLKTCEPDHYIPLVKGGSNWAYNIRISCRPCNRRKNAKDPAIWEAEINWKPRYTVPTLEMYEAAKNLSTHPLNPFIVCDDPLEEAA
jgi:5-methylcytosine-specific restriction endonuclease McrA